MTAARDSRTRATISSTRLDDDVVRAADEVDHGVGRRLDPFDEIWIQRERRPVEPRDGDHLSVPGPLAPECCRRDYPCLSAPRVGR